MAEGLPSVPEDGFEDPQGFQDWLKSLPEDRIKPIAQALCSRAALRALPNLHLTFSRNAAAQETFCDLTLATLRANSISRAALQYPAREIASAALSAAHSAALSADSAAASAAHSAAHSAARSAAHSAARSAALSAAHSAALSADSAAASAAHSAARSAALSADSAAASAAASAAHSAAPSAARSAVWQAITTDARAWVSGTVPLDLLATPLWPVDDPLTWWEDGYQVLSQNLVLLDEDGKSSNWSIWLEWYEAVARGRPAWGLPSEAAWELEKRIALGGGRGEEFWKQEPDEINRKIAEWVEEARRKVREEDQETTFDLNSIAPPEQIENATQLAVNDDGKIDLARPAPENRLLDTQSQRQEYFAAKSDALVLQDAGSNRLGKLLPELETLLRAMPDDFTAATVFDLWRAINRLRRTSNAHRALGADADGHEAKLEPSVAEDLDHLLDGLNILAFNDPKLHERDSNRIPPQDRATNEAARELMEPLVEDVVENEDLTTEAAAQTVEADIASASDADKTEHGAQAIDQAVKTERNTLAAFFSSLTQKVKSVMAGEAGFAWKEVRAGVYRGAGTAITALATAELTGFSTVIRSTFAYAVENATALKQVALQIFQNPRLAEMIDWIVKVFGWAS